MGRVGIMEGGLLEVEETKEVGAVVVSHNSVLLRYIC